MFFVSFFSFDLEDFKFQYVNLKAFGASFLYWVDFSINRPHLSRLHLIKPCNIFCTVQVIFFNCVANCFSNTGYEGFYCVSSNSNPRQNLFQQIHVNFVKLIHIDLFSSDSFPITTLTACTTLKIQPLWL